MLSSRPIAVHADGPPQVSMKTPGRILAKGRTTLQENSLYRAALPATVKARKVATNHTPFHTKSTKHPAIAKTAAKSILTKTTSKPLLDKTPFPNRALHTPHTAADKIAKLSFLEPDLDIPGSSQVSNLRPSSTRKSSRLPRHSGGTTSSNKFRTPVTTGNHWDVSDGEVELQGVNRQEEEREAAEVEDDDEIEYMPPTAIVPPYEPPFELPDYKVLGKALMQAAFSHPYDDQLPPNLDLNAYDENFFSSTCIPWDELGLPELDEDDSSLSVSATRPTRSATPKTSSTTALLVSKTSAPSRRPITRAAAKSGVTQATTSSLTKTMTTDNSDTKTTTSRTRSTLTRPTSVASTRPVTRSTLKASAATAAPRPTTSAAMYKAPSSNSEPVKIRTRAAARMPSGGNVAATSAPSRSSSYRNVAPVAPTRASRNKTPSSRFAREQSSSETVQGSLNDEVDVLLVFDETSVEGLDDDFKFDI